MKRVEIPTPKADMEICSYPEIPSPPPGGVVIKTAFCGICHSDVHMAENEFKLGDDAVLKYTDIPGVKYPMVFGHEISGFVHSMDPNGADDGLKVGDRVIVYPWTGCDECPFCDTGEGGMCASSLPIGCGVDGGFSEYVKIKRRDFVVKIPDELPMDVACMLPCSGVTGYHAVSKVKPTLDRFLELKGEAALLIIGAGGLGMWCLQTARARLPKGVKIIIADITQSKLETALARGADDIVLWNPKSELSETTKHTRSKGINNEIHAVIDFVNSSKTTEQAMGCLAKGAIMALVGLFGGAMSIPLPLFSSSLHQITGIFVGSLQQLKELVQLVAEAKLKPPNISFVTLEEIPQVLKKLKNGELDGRALVRF